MESSLAGKTLLMFDESPVDLNVLSCVMENPFPAFLAALSLAFIRDPDLTASDIDPRQELSRVDPEEFVALFKTFRAAHLTDYVHSLRSSHATSPLTYMVCNEEQLLQRVSWSWN